MAYVGQIHTLRVPIEDGWDTARIDAAFAEAYAGEYGNTLGDIATTIVSLRTVVEGQREHEPAAPGAAAAAGPAADRPPPGAFRRVVGHPGLPPRRACTPAR